MAELTPYSFMADVRYALVFVISYITLLLERLWNSFWPALTVVAFYGGIATLGIVRAFPPVAHAVLLFVLTTSFALAALHLGDKFRWPRAKEVRRAVEKQSGLRHRPLETALDKPISGLSNASRELWESYQKRVMLLRGRTLPYRPSSTAAARDPWSLRHAALLLLVIGLVVAQGDAWTRIKNGMFVDVRQWIHTQPAALEAWITPPEYTNLTPVFLAVTQTGAAVEKGAISVPAGSVLKVRISGHAEPPKLTYGEAPPATFTEAAVKSYTLDMPLPASGTLKIKQGWFRKLGEWPVTVTPDAPPDVAILETTEGDRNELKIHFRAKDDYGIATAFGTITPGKAIRDTFGTQPVEFDLQPPAPDKGEGSESVDLTGHPWAGSKVTLTLTAEDEAGHSVNSEPKELYLPERKFESAVARALVHERKRLIWYNNPLTQRIVVDRLASVAIYPENYKYDKIIFLGLNMAIKRLMYDGDHESTQSVIGLLWDLAVRAEDGGLSFAKRELSDALQRLSEALKDKNTTKEELQRLQEEVAEKMRDYMSTLSAEMQQRMRDGEKMKPISPELAKKLMERVDMQKLMEQMKELTQGSERERMQKMAEFLKRTVDNTDMNRMRQMQQQQQKAMEALDKLQKLIERQQELLDKTNHLKPDHKQQQEQQQQGDGNSGQQGRANPQQQQQAGGQQQQQQSGGQQQGSQQQGGGQQQQQQAGGEQGKSPFPPMPQPSTEGQQQDSGGQEQGKSQQQASGQQGEQGEQEQQGQQGQGQQGQGQQGQGQQAGNNGQPVPVPQQGQQGQQAQGGQGQEQGQGQQQGDQQQGQGQQSEGWKKSDGNSYTYETTMEMNDKGQGQGEQQGQQQGAGQGREQAQQGGGGEKEGHGEGGKKAAEGAPIRNSGDAAREQSGIRKELGDVVRDIANAMPDVPENFSNADQSMKGSHGSLQRGDTKGSAPQQKQALDELQSAQDQLLQQLADSMRDVMLTFGPNGGGNSDNGSCENPDPFGRCTDGTNTQNIGIPDESERRRVQEIQEELRSRSNDYQRPKVERDYIDRLLDQFE